MRSIDKIKAYGLVGIAILTFFSCTKKETGPGLSEDLKIHIKLADSIFLAGDSIEVKIINEGNSIERQICLLVSGSTTEEVHCKFLQKDQISFFLSPNITEVSGKLFLSLFAGTKELDRAEIYIMAMEASGKINASLGPKTLTVGEEEKAMLVSFPLDKYHNMMENLTKVSVQSYGPDANTSAMNLRTDNGYVFAYFGSEEKIGARYIGSSSGEAHMREKEIFYVPGIPKSISLAVEMKHPYSDGKQFCTLYTLPLKDQFGHKLKDGTHVVFQLEDEQGKFFLLEGITVDGIARTELIHPNQAMKYMATAQIPGLIKSLPREIIFLENIADFKLEFIASEKLLLIGPVFGKLGALAPDGTPVHIQYWVEERQYEKDAKLIDGFLTIPLTSIKHLDLSDSCRITLGAITKNIWF